MEAGMRNEKTFADLKELYEIKKDSISEDEIKEDFERILNEKEVESYSKMQKQLMAL